MHPHNLVFSPVTLKKLVDLVGATNMGAEMDPSHLMWQGMDIVASISWLGPLVFVAAAKDAAITPGVDIRGVLDTSFGRVPADAEARYPPATGSGSTSGRPNPGWKFVAVGIGHDVEYWTEFLRALAEVAPDCAVNIEHEDADYSRLDGRHLRRAPGRKIDPPTPGLVGYGVGGRYFHTPFIEAARGIELAGVVTRSPYRRAEVARTGPASPPSTRRRTSWRPASTR